MLATIIVISKLVTIIVISNEYTTRLILRKNILKGHHCTKNAFLH